MKVSVQICGEWLEVPVADGQKNMKWLGQEALRRFSQMDSENIANKVQKPHRIVSIRKTNGEKMLDFSDLVKDVLEDGDVISVG